MTNLFSNFSLSLPESIGYGTLLHGVLCLAVYLHILSRPRDSRTALLWIFIITSLPAAGFIAYVMFGINTIPTKGWKKQFSDSTFQKRQLQVTRKTLPLAQMYAERNSFIVEPVKGDQSTLNRILNQMARNHPLLDGNNLEILDTATIALETMFTALGKAKHHIHLSTYILQDDQVGQQLMNLLVERAQAGVKVRVMYDAFGSAGASLRLFFVRYRKVPNLRLIGFSQANILKRKFQVNQRNHRKLLIIDGVTAFTGGVNFHDVYMGKKDKPGIIDYHFRIHGPVVLEMQYTFLRDWYYMTGESFEQLFSRELFPLPQRAGTMAARIQNSGPTRDETGAALDTFLAALNMAQKQVLLVTPYFVPPESLVIALRQAAYRGVDVKVLLPEENNHPLLQLASQALFTPLLTSGIRIFKRYPPFIHAKITLIDDTLAIIGSGNLDPRSFFLNYETNIAVFDREFASRLKASVLGEFSQSEELHYADWRRRPFLHQMAENFFNLFHPIT